jgi:hypothetical protein
MRLDSGLDSDTRLHCRNDNLGNRMLRQLPKCSLRLLYQCCQDKLLVPRGGRRKQSLLDIKCKHYFLLS